MANTLTALQPLLFSLMRLVPRELTGLLGAVARDFDDKGVAKGDTVKVGVSPTMTTGNVTVGQQFTVGVDRVFGSEQLTLNQEKEVTFHLTAEQERSLMNGGTYVDTFKQTVLQGIRALVNGIESYVWGVAEANASRAVGTAGTTPFNTAGDLSDTANALKELLDNGCPQLDLACVLGTTAGANLRGKQSVLFKVNEAGTDELLRQGILGRLHSFDLRESAAVTTHTKGTGTGYLVNNGAGYAVGATAITVDTGSGTIVAGDIITFAGDTNKYVVETALTANVVTIQEPGLKVAAADNTAITVGNNHVSNLALHRSAVAVVCRPSLQPAGAIAEQTIISDPQTGLSFLFLRVVGNGLVSYYIRVVYDAFAPNAFGIIKVQG